MAVIIFAIILTTAVSIIINTTTAEIIRDYKTRFGSEVSITYDYTNLDAITEYKPLTSEQMLLFGESEYLQNKIIEQTMSITFEDLHALDDDKEGMQMGGSISISNEGGSSSENPEEPEYLKILGNLIASNQSIISEDFQNGLRVIADGAVYSEVNDCLVSEQFAELNDLSVGDTIFVKSYMSDSPMAHTLTISGIFEDYTMLEDDLGMYEHFPLCTI